MGQYQNCRRAHAQRPQIGLTSKAMQASSQISEPDYGALLDDMFFHDGGDIPTDRFIVPRIEVELAFVLAKRCAALTARCSTSTTPRIM